MIDNSQSGSDTVLHQDTDATGKAALLLVESLIHGLIAKQLMTVAEAIEIVDAATEVMIDGQAEAAEPSMTSKASVELLRSISASLRFDLPGRKNRGDPV